MKKITLVIMLLIILSGCDTKTYSDPKIEPNTQTISNTNCEKKKFQNSYTNLYDSKEVCMKYGNNAMLYVIDNINSSVINYNCEEIVDECGIKYWGVYFLTSQNDNSRFYY